MSEYRPPVLGFDYVADIARVEWKDGSFVCGGILGRLDPETLAREAVDRAHKEYMRAQPNVVLLEDVRNGFSKG